MKKLLLLILVGVLVFVFFAGRSGNSEDSQNNGSGEGVITETYETYKGGIEDAKSAVSAIEDRAQ